DGVEAVQLLLQGGDLRQIPAQRRRLAADALPAIQCAATGQDATDGAYRGQGRDLPLLELIADGPGAVEAEVAVLTQLLTQLQNLLLEEGVGALGVLRRMRPIGPIDAVQALALGTAHPVQHGGGADTEVTGDAPQRLP